MAGFLRGAVGSTRLAEGQHHHGGVVDIGIKLVGIFERPAGRLGIGPLHRPIALTPDFLGEQPIGALAQRRVLGIGLTEGV